MGANVCVCGWVGGGGGSWRCLFIYVFKSWSPYDMAEAENIGKKSSLILLT